MVPSQPIQGAIILTTKTPRTLTPTSKEINFKVTFFVIISRRELDSQLNSKNSVHSQEVEADKRYYEFVVKQANAQKDKEEREKLERMVKRRNMEEDNARVMEMTKNSRSVINSLDDSSSKFEIGTRS